MGALGASPPLLLLLPLVFDVVWGRKGLISALQLHNPLPWCSSGFLWQESLQLLSLISSLLPACVRGRDPLRFHWDWDPGGNKLLGATPGVALFTPCLEPFHSAATPTFVFVFFF